MAESSTLSLELYTSHLVVVISMNKAVIALAAAAATVGAALVGVQHWASLYRVARA